MTGAPYRYLQPSNLVTYLSLLGGLAAIVAARSSGERFLPGALIALCALADVFDGRFAGCFARTPDQSRFGVELDSLTDALSFGLVPVVVLTLLLPLGTPGETLFWLAAAGAYVLAAVTRLGAYNLHQVGRGGFVGLPTTCAGLLTSSLLIAEPSTLLAGAVLVVASIAMVAPIPVPRLRGRGMGAFAGLAVLLAIVHGVRAVR